MKISNATKDKATVIVIALIIGSVLFCVVFFVKKAYSNNVIEINKSTGTKVFNRGSYTEFIYADGTSTYIGNEKTTGLFCEVQK